jgi:AraC-like DNA-binding protein
MTLLVDTTAVAPDERFDLWSEAASAVLMPMHVRRREAHPFSGRIVGYELGPLRLYRICGDRSTVIRTPQMIRAQDPEFLQVTMELRSRQTVVQGRRSTLLMAGNIVSCDSSSPFLFEALDPFELLVCEVPKHLLRPHTDRICRQTAVQVPGDSGAGSLVAGFVRGVLDGLDGGTVLETDEDVVDVVLDLVRALYVGCGALAPREPLIRSIKTYVVHHLGDPALSQAAVARVHFISARYLRSLFEAEGDCFSAWVRRERLERCRRDLADPAFAQQTILAIGSRWGLTNPAYFSRAFRAAYGCSPREYRCSQPPPS